jgi:integrase
MPKKAKALTPALVKRITRPGLHAVGGVDGLRLQVSDSGARSWILRVTVGDRRPDIGLGGYPDVSLERARDQAREIRDQIRQGIDPLAARRAARDALAAGQAKRITFAQAAKQAHAKRKAEFKNAKHAAQWINTLTTYAFPTLGHLPVDQIEMPHVLSVLEPIWLTKTETATRVRQRVEAVLSWAAVSGYRSGTNPAAWKGNLEHALPKARKLKRVRHHPALPWAQMGEFIKTLRARPGVAARALEFAILTAARSSEVRLARWPEIDLDRRLWTIPAERIKAGKQHRVPLSDRAMEILKALPRSDGTDLVFLGVKNRPLSENTLGEVAAAIQPGITVHGFRSSFKDWARSSTAYPDEVSELALAHVNDDTTRAAYARDELLPKRTRLMRDWARFCATIPKRGDVVEMNRDASRG